MSDNLSSKNVVLFGAGPMAMDYAKVLKHLDTNFTVVGRSSAGTEKFQEQTGIAAIANGVSGWLGKGNTNAEYGIIAINCETLATAAIELMDAGIRKILLEKPAGLTAPEIHAVCEHAKKTDTRIFVAYNRRFYASVIEAKKLIADDGEVLSFNFEFTEWCDDIADKLKHSDTGKNWFLANSSHIVDMAFYLGGEPKELHTCTAGGNDWHPTATVFAGAGVTHSGALFSYQANWDAPGRWGVEVLTRKHRYIFRPVEKLQIIKHNSVTAESVDIDDRLDLKFKPGLYQQTKSFLNEDSSAPLLNIHEHYEKATTCYEKIIRPKA
jgi:predicted dehydrogenase